MRGRGGGGCCKPGNSNAMIRAPLPAAPKAGTGRRPPGGRGGRAEGLRGHIPRGSAAGPSGARAEGCGLLARVREARSEALGRAAVGAWHLRSRAAAAPGPASPRQHRSLFTSLVPAARPPATRAAAASSSSLLRAPTRAPPVRSNLSPAAQAGERAAGRAHAASLSASAHPRRGGAPLSRPVAVGGQGSTPPSSAPPTSASPAKPEISGAAVPSATGAMRAVAVRRDSQHSRGRWGFPGWGAQGEEGKNRRPWEVEGV